MEDISSCHESIYLNRGKTCIPRKIHILRYSDITIAFCSLHSNISVTPHLPLSTNLWKSKLEKKPFQRKKCLSSTFFLRRCTLIRIGRNDEKNQHLQEKWTLSIMKEGMKGWSARLGLWKFSHTLILNLLENLRDLTQLVPEIKQPFLIAIWD